MPQLIMLVGVPCSGKTTFARKSGLDNLGIILSTDEAVEVIAIMARSTYSDVFQWAIKPAEKILNSRLEYAIEHECSILWDQTNLTKASRAKKLAKIPSHYKKTAYFFRTPQDDELYHRNVRRSKCGKHLDPALIKSMSERVEVPSLDEGFDKIHFVSADGIIDRPIKA